MAVREKGRKSTAFRSVAVLMIVPIVSLLAFFGWNWLNGGETPDETWQEFKAAGQPHARPAADSVPSRRVAAAEAVATPKREVDRKEEPSVSTPSRGGDIVLIIDDLGFEGQPIERVMALDPNVTCSVLPNGNRAAQIANAFHARGYEVMCHLPMQPKGNEAPGEGAILTRMADDEIAELTRRNIEAVPHARGVNNHMGSLATSDRRVMSAVLGAVGPGIFFVDSRTAGNSVAESVSKELKIPTAARDVFLDDDPATAAIRRQLHELADMAAERGVAIGIGHPRPATLDVLEQEIPKLRARGFRFVRASSVVR